MPDPTEPPLLTEGLAPDWRRYDFDWQAGRPAVMILTQNAACNDFRALLRGFTLQASAFARRGADILVLATAAQMTTIRADMPAAAPVEIVECNEDFLLRSLVPADRPVAVMVDRNLRVVTRSTPSPGTDIVADCLASLDGLLAEVPAPVLILPNLLSRDLCRSLINRFDAGKSTEGRVAGIDSAGMPFCNVDHAVKKRQDLQIRTNDPVLPELRARILQRCAPEIAKAFQAKVTHTDRFMLARYDNPGGWFRRHRDNSTDNVAFRQFAVSVNLNTEDYAGGHLTFPEYSDQPFCPPTGGGLIFSASLLHEVTQVTSGRRYVLLTFMHDLGAEAQRLAYEARMLSRLRPGSSCVPEP